MPLLERAIEIVSRLGQSFCIVADAAPATVIALVLDLRREVSARIIETGR
jgi:hypothetical protein